ncbi:GPW/gp25 family protein [Enterobacter ludwigii]|uniref:GPW/gp25 family protein n=1 Tax=Enterobacter ludwigii TaxID=299767 RepID=UPI0024323BE6|nr:GPW/gp25 family protein [Enterobacter ludwigii]WGA04011.1 GPW/gp25 family protein [Enterobacter ludwigii]
MQPSLLHRLKNIKQCESYLYHTHNKNYDVVNTLITDLFLLFSSRPLISGAEHNETVGTSVLNYGVRIVDNSKMNDSRELIQKKIEESILHAIHLYEKRLCNVTIEQYRTTAEKISFKVCGFFFNILVSFIVSWEISAASYSLNIIR